MTKKEDIEKCQVCTLAVMVRWILLGKNIKSGVYSFFVFSSDFSPTENV